MLDTKSFRISDGKVDSCVVYSRVVNNKGDHASLNSIDELNHSVGIMVYLCVGSTFHTIKSYLRYSYKKAVLSEIATTPIDGDYGWKEQRHWLGPYHIETSGGIMATQ